MRNLSCAAISGRTAGHSASSWGNTMMAAISIRAMSHWVSQKRPSASSGRAASCRLQPSCRARGSESAVWGPPGQGMHRGIYAQRKELAAPGGLQRVPHGHGAGGCRLTEPGILSRPWSICGKIRTCGALPHATLAEWHHSPLGHANGKWMGQDSNLRCFCVTDLQSAALAARHTHP